jgi:hypothetical protein
VCRRPRARRRRERGSRCVCSVCCQLHSFAARGMCPCMLVHGKRAGARVAEVSPHQLPSLCVAHTSQAEARARAERERQEKQATLTRKKQEVGA